MREFSVPVAYAVQPDDNITDDLVRNAANWPDAFRLKRKVNGVWAPVTWREFAGGVRELAAGFIAAGIRPGDRVALMSRTRYEWTLLDYAILTAGGVVVPVYPTSSIEQVEWILGDSGAVAALVETDDHAENIAAVRGALPALAHVWQIDGGQRAGLADLRARGTRVTPGQVEERRRTRGASDLAEIVYTWARPAARRAACSATATSSPTPATAWRTTASRGSSTSTRRRCCSCRSRTAMPSSSSTRRSTRARYSGWPTWRTPSPSFRPTGPRRCCPCRGCGKRRTTAPSAGLPPRDTARSSRAEAVAIAYSKALDAGGPGPVLRLHHAVFDRYGYLA